MISIGCFIFAMLFCYAQVEAVEMTGGSFQIDAVAFANGGGPTTSSSHMMVMSIIGEGLIPLSSASSGQFSLQAGQVQLIYGMDEVLGEDKDWLISEIICRAEVLGELIPEKTWQKDDDPYISWGIIVEPAALVDGFSVAVDASPDGTIDTYAPQFQFADGAIANGRHVMYVAPFYSSGIPEMDSVRSFEIWIDRLGPYVNQLGPASGALLSDNKIAVACRIADADSGVDPTSVRMELNGRQVSGSYDTETGIFSSGSEEYLAEGKNTVVVTARDMAGNAASQAWEFVADSQPPSGTFSINAGAPVSHSAYVSLHLDASDAVSSVASVVISNDGIFDTEMNHPYPYQTVITSWLVLEPDVDGVKTVFVKFLDAAGNISGAYTDQITLHRLTPDTRIISGPSAATVETQAAFTFESSRQGALFAVRIDNQSWSAWTLQREATFTDLVYANHYFYVKSGYDLNADGAISIDEEDPTPAQWIWTVGDEATVSELQEKILFWKR